MSHQTGIKANEKLKKFFSSYLDLNVRVFKVSIENEELDLVHYEKVNGSWNEDFDRLVPPLVLPQQPAYILYRLDSKDEMTGFDWLLISWSPDESPVRQKMLYASTKATLKQEFGSGQIKEEYFATTMDDVSLKGLERHRVSVKSPAPLTTREEELVELRKSEATGLTEISVDSRSQTLSGVAFPLLPDALKAVQRLAQKEVNYAQFNIDDNDKMLSRLNCLPSINPVVETDPFSKAPLLKILIPINKMKRSLSFSCELAASSDEFRTEEGVSVIQKHIFSFDQKDIAMMKSVSAPTTCPVNSAGRRNHDRSLYVDGTTDLEFSSSPNQTISLLSGDDTSPEKLQSVSKAISSAIDCRENQSDSCFVSLPGPSTSFKRKHELESNPASRTEAAKKKKTELVQKKTNEQKNVPERNKDVEKPTSVSKQTGFGPIGKGTKGKSIFRPDDFSSELDRIFETIPEELNEANYKSVVSFCESFQEKTMLAKARGLTLPSFSPDTPARIRSLCDLIRINPLIDEEMNFVSNSEFPLVMVSADVAIILTTLSENLPFVAEAVSHIALFVFNHYFHSVLPVFQTAGPDHGLTEKEFNKKFAKNGLKCLLNRLSEIVQALSRIPRMFDTLTDAFSKLTAVCISSFFAPLSVSFQHNCLKLIASFFSSLEKRRSKILDEIISTVALLKGESSFILKTFQLEQRDVKIQFLTAALLSFTCSSTNYLSTATSAEQIQNSFPIESRQAETLFYKFYNKLIINSTSNTNFKSILENVILDLLKIRNEQEWPSCNAIFKYLHRLLTFYLNIKTVERSTQLVCLDYLKLVLPDFRKNFLMTATVSNSLNKIVSRDSSKDLPSKKTDATALVYSDEVCCLKLLIQILAGQKVTDPNGTIQFYCHVLLEELQRNVEKLNPKNTQSKSKSVKKDVDAVYSFAFGILQELKSAETHGKKSKLGVLNIKDQELITTVCQFLQSSNPFAKYSDKLLKLIILFICQSTPQIQLKAVGCLLSVLAVDRNLLLFNYVEIAIKRSLTNKSPIIRDRVADFLGPPMLSNPDFFNKYFESVSDRILDVSVPVRKTVLSILCKVCLDCPEYANISNIYIMILRRLTDEQQVVKVAVNFFKCKWINTIIKDGNSTVHVIIEILSILNVARSNNAEKCFVKAFQCLANDNQSKDVCCSAFERIAKCIAGGFLERKKLDEESAINCYFLLTVISSCRSEYAESLTPILYPFLCTKLVSERSSAVLSFVLQIFELIILKQSSFFENEEKKRFLTKLFLSSHTKAGNQQILIKSIGCFAMISKINKDFSVAVETFLKHYNRLMSYFNDLHQSSTKTNNKEKNESICRTLLTLGALIKYISFSKMEKAAFDRSLVNKVVKVVVDLLDADKENKVSILKAFALISSRFAEVILSDRVVKLFAEFLKNSIFSAGLKVQILFTINSYFEEDNLRSRLLNERRLKLPKNDDLRVMSDVSAGRPSEVAQKYLPSILKCCLTGAVDVRVTAVKTLITIVNFKLLHPNNFLHYLVCLLADLENVIAHTASKTLVDYQAVHSSLVRPVCLKGILLSFELLKAILPQSDVVRGFISVQGTLQSRFDKLFELLKQRKDRINVVTCIVNQFNCSDDSETKLDQLLYLADNLAYFPYQETQEVLSILCQISTVVSNDAVPLFDKIADVLSKSRKIVKLKAADESAHDSPSVSRTTNRWQKCGSASSDAVVSLCESGHKYILLLQLWHFLKSLYKVSDKCLLAYQRSSSSGPKKSVAKSLQTQSFEPESVIQLLNFSARNYSDDKENLVCTPYLDLLKSSSLQFDELNSRLNSESLKNVSENP